VVNAIVDLIIQAQHRVSLKSKKWAGQQHITWHYRCASLGLRHISLCYATANVGNARNVWRKPFGMQPAANSIKHIPYIFTIQGDPNEVL